MDAANCSRARRKVADMLLDGDLWGGTRLPRTEPSRCPRVHDEGASNERS